MKLQNDENLCQYGPVAQLGERSVRIREVKGSNPSRSTKSPRTLYRLRLFFYKSHRLLILPRLLFQIEPAALGFDLVLDASLKTTVSIYRCDVSRWC